MTSTPRPLRELLHLGLDIDVAVVDRVLDAEAAQRVVLGRRRRADHRRPPQPRELRRRDPQPAAGVVHQHGLARGERRHPVERNRRRQVADRHRRRLRVAQAIRKAVGLRGRHDDRVRVAAEARERDDAIAFVGNGDVAADRVHDAGDFVADDHRRLGRVRVEPDAGEDVGEIDARGAHPDPDLPVARRGVGRLAHLEDVGPAVPGDHRLAHPAGA